MARRMRYPANVKRGERMSLGKRYRIVGLHSKQVGFKGTLVARFPVKGKHWAIFKDVK
jgi:hypothetical protein